MAIVGPNGHSAPALLEFGTLAARFVLAQPIAVQNLAIGCKQVQGETGWRTWRARWLSLPGFDHVPERVLAIRRSTNRSLPSHSGRFKALDESGYSIRHMSLQAPVPYAAIHGFMTTDVKRDLKLSTVDRLADLTGPELVVKAKDNKPAKGRADENGDWLRNILYLSKSTTAISCGACPPFHQTSQRADQARVSHGEDCL